MHICSGNRKFSPAERIKEKKLMQISIHRVGLSVTLVEVPVGDADLHEYLHDFVHP